MSLSAYLPRVIAEWQREAPGERSRAIPGSLVFMDISGFTAMSERLAKKGTIGAEEVAEVLDASFTTLLAGAYEEGGSLLKFGGDAMLLFFSGEGHAVRACRAAAGMRNALRKHGRFTTSAGIVRLRMSVGVHSGDVHMFLVGSSHRELIVTGPAVTRTVEMESAAAAGEIRISDVTAAALPKSCVTRSPDGGWLLASIPSTRAGSGEGAPPQEEIPNAEEFVSVSIRRHLSGAGTPDREHRYAVVCFIHFEGVDDLLQHSGAPAVEQALSELIEAVQQATDEFGSCFLATDIDRDGGKVIITAGVPTTAGSDEEAVLRAVSQILASRTQLPLRIGVNAGPVFAGDIGPAYRRTYTVMGDAVNLAARLMSRAEPGQAITVPAVVDRTRTTFDATPLEPFAVKGKAKPITAVAVGEPRGRRVAQDDAELPLIGREQELSLLLATLDGVRRSRRAFVDLVGDAGMGKTRLVEELQAKAEHTNSCVTSCEQYESSTAYFPLRRLLCSLLGIDGSDGDTLSQQLTDAVHRVAPNLDEWLPLVAVPFDVSVPPTPTVDRVAPRFRRAQLHRVLAELLERAATAPTLFLIEDVQWMDDATREFLSDVLASSRDRPWFFLVTRRPGAPLFTDLDEDSVIIQLDPLPPPAAEELANLAAGDMPLSQHDLRALTERAGGNPFFLRAMAAARRPREAETLPDSVEALVNAQVDRLRPAERRVLRYASVVGPTFNTRLLQDSMGDMLQTSADEACRTLTDFLDPLGRDSYRFRHTLVREAAYRGLPFRLRRQLHERMGLSIERRYGRRSDSRAEMLSLHFHQARTFEKSLRYSRIAADRAKQKSANIEAATFYQRAIDAAMHAGNVADADKASLYESLGDVYELAAVYDAADRALSHARRYSPGRARLCRLLRKEGVLRERLGQYSQALRWYGRGLKYADEADANDVHQLQLAYAGVRFRQGRYADCTRWCRTVIPAAEVAGDVASVAHAYYLLDHAYTMLGSKEAGEFRSLALPLFEELGDLIGQANVLNNLGVSAAIEGDWDEALRLYERSREARDRVGDVVGAATATNNIGEVLLDRGLIDEAEPLFREALRVWRAANYAVGVAVATSALGLAATRARRFPEARQLLEQALQSFRDIGAESFVLETQARLAELHLASGEDDLATDLIETLLARNSADDLGATAAALQRLRGYALMRDSNWDDASESIEESLRLARSMSASYELALSLQARAALARATATDPGPFEDESTSILQRLGVTSVPSPAVSPSGVEPATSTLPVRSL